MIRGEFKEGNIHEWPMLVAVNNLNEIFALDTKTDLAYMSAATVVQLQDALNVRKEEVKALA